MAGDGFRRRTFLCATVAAGTATAVGIGARAAEAAVPGFYNPFGGYPITGTWQEHLNRGSLGGIDYGMPVGTRLPAAGGGVVTNDPNNGTGGYTVTIQHDNGYRTQYLHLSQFLLANGTRVDTGEIVGLSGGAVGAPGSGSSTGPHLHWHMIDPSGTRINPLVYLDGAGTSPPAYTQVFETADSTGWRPLPVGYDGQPVLAGAVSAVLRADGTKIVYTVRDGRLYEAASNTGWRNQQVPNHDQVSAVSAIPYNGAVVVYTVRGGAVYEASSANWQPLLVGYNGQPVHGTAISAVLRADGTKIVYTVRDGRLYEAASNTGWRNQQVPNHDQVSAVSAIPYNGAVVVYTVRGGAVYEASSANWQPLLVGYNGQPVHGTAVSAITRTDGTRIIYTVRDGYVHEAASNTGWQNLRVPNLTGTNTIAALNANGIKILYSR
ncbi:M23 family metallopeptidase [Micromonospora sp. NPDC047465]|uniref:M23 family metallopeptidase n=1 Tax=Micromonospora sp. NPDC047465 TaxID=3154813 RepID=UPI0033CD5796